MKNYYNKTLKKINFNILKISAVLVVMFYGINFSIEYATDTYSTFMEADTWKWMLYENGRLFNASIYYLFETLQIPTGYIYKLSYLLAIFCLMAATYILAGLINEFCNHEFISTAVSFLTLSNFFIIEYFLFIEKGLFMLAVLLCTLAAYYTIYFFHKGEKKFLLFSLLLLLWAVFIYQIMLALYVILCLPFILKYSTNIKTFIIYNIITAFIYSIPLLSAFLVLKLFLKSSRMGGIENAFVNFFRQIPNILMVTTSQWYHMPSRLFLICLSIILGLAFLFPLFSKTTSAIRISVGTLIYLTLGTTFTAFFPLISGITSVTNPRTLYPYGCLLGILMIYILIHFPIDINHLLHNFTKVIIIAILFIQLLTFNSVFIERYKTNQSDKYYCEIIKTKIHEYETENGISIDTICFYHDKATTWYEHGCDESTLNPRAQSCGWSNLTALNLYLDTDYIKGESLTEYDEYFSQYNWDTYSDKQIIFKDNTLHLCIY